jgi:23S rRNA G2445 N2-methylase RlmL
MMKLFAITTRGLETLCAAEMIDFLHLHVQSMAYRHVLATFDGPPSALLELRTPDDLYLHLATWPDIVRQRESLKKIEEYSAELPLAQALTVLPAASSAHQPPYYSITVSFVGKRNYSTEEIKQAVRQGMARYSAWEYQENDRPNALNLRVFIEGDQALVGLRLSGAPLHQRSYKQENIPGSTKPSVAAAMVRLANITPGAVVADPCCGAGTLLAEAALSFAPVLDAIEVIGGDNDPLAVQASRINLQQAGIQGDPVQQWDVTRLPLPAQSVDYIISNLPWDRQVTVPGALDSFYAAVCAEIRRVIRPNARVVLLANDPQALKIPDFTLQSDTQISLFGQNPHLLVYAQSSYSQ